MLIVNKDNMITSATGLIVVYDKAGNIRGFVLDDTHNSGYWYFVETSDTTWDNTEAQYESIEEILSTFAELEFKFTNND